MFAGILGRDLWEKLARLVLLICLYPITVWIYNLTLHPLAKYPGPVVWRASRLANLRAAWSGRYPYLVQELHNRYGDVVRVAPNELSFANPAAWDDIYSNSAGSNGHAFPKSQTWHGSLGHKDSPESIFTKPDFREHARQRRFLDPAFTERAVLQQEPIIHQYVDLCISKLRERITASRSRHLATDLVPWLNFIMFDIIGELGFGESFGCLDKCEYEEWMSSMNGAVKATYFMISIRHYSIALSRFLFWLLPAAIPGIKKQQEDHHNQAAAKVRRRLESEVERPDIVSQMLRSKDGKEGLSMGELLENAKLFIVAGSETTVTVLTGIFFHLIENPECLKKLKDEVRGAFGSLQEMSLTELKKLEYLDAVIHEGLRMCNPNPIGHMRITPPSGGVVAGERVPGNILLTVHPVTLSFSPNLFHNPTKFSPDRWLPENSTAADSQISAYHNDNRKSVRAFGWGPQSCIGEPLAWAEMRICLAKLVWALEFDMLGEERIGETARPRQEEKKGKKRWMWKWEDQNVFGVVEKRGLEVEMRERGQQ